MDIQIISRKCVTDAKELIRAMSVMAEIEKSESKPA